MKNSKCSPEEATCWYGLFFTYSIMLQFLLVNHIFDGKSHTFATQLGTGIATIPLSLLSPDSVPLCS